MYMFMFIFVCVCVFTYVRVIYPEVVHHEETSR